MSDLERNLSRLGAQEKSESFHTSPVGCTMGKGSHALGRTRAAWSLCRLRHSGLLEV